jgi:hypothetical protein
MNHVGIHVGSPENEGGYKMARFLDLQGNDFRLMESSAAKKAMEQ